MKKKIMRNIAFIMCLFASLAKSGYSQEFIRNIDIRDYQALQENVFQKEDGVASKPGLSKAPIIAFGIVGGFVGGSIGALLDPVQEGPKGQFSLHVSKGGNFGFVAGIIAGGYIGYRLAKRDQQKLLERQKSRIDGEK